MEDKKLSRFEVEFLLKSSLKHPIAQADCPALHNTIAKFQEKGLVDRFWIKDGRWYVTLEKEGIELVERILSTPQGKPSHFPKHLDLIFKWKDGEDIQVRGEDGSWVDCPKPSWMEDREYRVKPKREIRWIPIRSSGAMGLPCITRKGAAHYADSGKVLCIILEDGKVDYAEVEDV